MIRETAKIGLIKRIFPILYCRICHKCKIKFRFSRGWEVEEISIPLSTSNRFVCSSCAPDAITASVVAIDGGIVSIQVRLDSAISVHAVGSIKEEKPLISMITEAESREVYFKLKASEKIHKAQEEIADILQRLHDETGLIPVSYDFTFTNVATMEDRANGKNPYLMGSRYLSVTNPSSN